jgi:hypothetical protein
MNKEKKMERNRMVIDVKKRSGYDDDVLSVSDCDQDEAD